MPSISFMVHFFIPFQRTITTWAVVLGLQLLLMDPSRLSAQQGESQASAQGEEKSSEEALIAAEYRELLELDDMALQEVDDWIRESNATNDGVDDTSLISLPARIEQRLKPVRAAYDAFIQKHPKHVGVRLAYASFLTDRGDEVLAAPHLMKATELNPENPAAWNNLGNQRIVALAARLDVVHPSKRSFTDLLLHYPRSQLCALGKAHLKLENSLRKSGCPG